MTESSPPFVIWTLQRTGGTNLTKHLARRSGLRTGEHEPFNVGRLHGAITAEWQQAQDAGKLERAMREVAARPALIKHCVEMVPWAVSRALADATLAAGWRHLILYRRQARDRLLSLHFARSTGIWGVKAAERAGDIDPGSEPIPVEKLIQHEMHCIRLLESSFEHLREHGGDPATIAFEDVYGGQRDLALRALLPALRTLGLRNGRDDEEFVDEVRADGDQGTRSRYEEIPGLDEFERALAGLQPAQFVSRPREYEIIALDAPEWVRFVRLNDNAGSAPRIAGALLLGADAPAGLKLRMGDAGRRVPVRWGLPSPHVAKRFPAVPAAANARFQSEPLPRDCSGEIWLESDAGERYPLFRYHARQ